MEATIMISIPFFFIFAILRNERLVGIFLEFVEKKFVVLVVALTYVSYRHETSVDNSSHAR